MAREKDKQLAARCRSMAEAATRALGWLDDNEKLVGTRKAGLERNFKRNAVEARKLAIAAERPMSVGVFGASQAGKSFLIGGLITPPDSSVKVIFGEGDKAERLDFLNEVNPVGGDETTGLVTRFSVVPSPSISPDYPVVLRLLREADVVKIFANTFLLDLRGRGEQPLTPERIREVFEGFGTPGPNALPGLADVDVYEIEAYLKEELEDHPLNAREDVSEAFWHSLERIGPYLAPEQRAQALSILWGEIPEFTALFRELKEALDALEHPETAYAPLADIRDRQKGILHVNTIYSLDTSDEQGQALVTVMTPKGKTAALRKPVVTALTAELRVTLEDKPWPFFEHTDLLDFPGARGRESKTAEEFLRGDEAKPTNRAYCFLRGKIALLFDKYSADLDLNTMLLCADDRNQEVRKLGELIQRWVSSTHGRRPEERADKRVALFLCMTKADTLFDEKAGASPADMIKTRINKDIEFYASWTKEWTPGQAFDNVFFVRNPKFMRKDLFEYEAIPEGADEGHVPLELGLKANQVERLESFKQVFAGTELVGRHVARPVEKIEAVLQVNDGGIMFLASALEPTCDPDLKYDQILPRAQSLAERMETALVPFHEAGDLAERVKERSRKARQVMRAFAARPHLLGRFIAEISADEATLGGRFMESARGNLGNGNGAEGEAPRETTVPPVDLGSGGITIDLPDDDEDEPLPEEERTAPPPQLDLAERYANEAVAYWLSRLEQRAGEERLALAYGITPEHFSTVASELGAAARRFELAERIAGKVRPIVQYHSRPDEQVHAVAMTTSLEINHLVDKLGRDLAEPQEDESAAAGTELFAKPPAPISGGLPALPADVKEMERVRGAYLTDWLKALDVLARENAASAQGALVDIEQNAILGDILAKVRG